MSLENQSALSSSNHSSYPLSETETDFAFITERGAVYHLDFTSDSDYIPDTPFADSVYSFSILPVAGKILVSSQPSFKHYMYSSKLIQRRYCSTCVARKTIRSGSEAACLANGSPDIKKLWNSQFSLSWATLIHVGYRWARSPRKLSRRVSDFAGRWTA